MKIKFKNAAVWLWIAAISGLPDHGQAFALLGPYEPWMQQTNGMREPGRLFSGFPIPGLRAEDVGLIAPAEIGGPMDLGSGYRWNVPVITYGFDSSFVNFFGTNGVAAVESAINTLNALPPASGIVLTNFPLFTKQYIYSIQARSPTEKLYDLKQQTLSVLLEQLGLSPATRYIYVLKRWDPGLLPAGPNGVSFEYDWGAWAIPSFIVQRNFDPETLGPTAYVNEAFYSSYIASYDGVNHLMVSYPTDPMDSGKSTVADSDQGYGECGAGLTRDDVGGLRYLLSPQTVQFENLLPDVQSDVGELHTFRRGALRPGVNKITFVRQPVNPGNGKFQSFVQHYTDFYFARNTLLRQPVRRVVTKPDILFRVADLSNQTTVPLVECTGTTNWINNAAVNGNPSGAGPGVIPPPVNITFSKAGRMFQHDEGTPDDSAYENSGLWSTFDNSTNAPIIYPAAQVGTNQTIFRMWLFLASAPPQAFDWQPSEPTGKRSAFQTSTNLVDWTTSFVFTNDGHICTYFNYSPASDRRFYRLAPQ